MDEQLLGELAVGLQRRHQLGHLLARGHRLQRHHVGVPEPRGGRSRPGRCGRGGAGAGTPGARARAGWRGRSPPDPTRSARCRRSCRGSSPAARGDAGSLLAPHPLQPRLEVVAQQPRPVLALDPAPAPVQLEQHVGVEVAVDLVERRPRARARPSNGGSGTGLSVRAALRTDVIGDRRSVVGLGAAG